MRRCYKMLETIQLSHIPPHHPLYVTLYQSLKNAPFLRQQLLDGNADFEYAFIDASIVLLFEPLPEALG